MNKIFLPTVGPHDWQKLLADPEKQWRTGYSARTIAYAWEAAKGHFPPEVERIFPEAGDKRVGNLEILLGFPECDPDPFSWSQRTWKQAGLIWNSLLKMKQDYTIERTMLSKGSLFQK